MLSPGLEVLMSPTKQISQLLGHMYLFFLFFFFFSVDKVYCQGVENSPLPLLSSSAQYNKNDTR